MKHADPAHFFDDTPSQSDSWPGADAVLPFAAASPRRGGAAAVQGPDDTTGRPGRTDRAPRQVKIRELSHDNKRRLLPEPLALDTSSLPPEPPYHGRLPPGATLVVHAIENPNFRRTRPGLPCADAGFALLDSRSIAPPDSEIDEIVARFTWRGKCARFGAVRDTLVRCLRSIGWRVEHVACQTVQPPPRSSGT